MISQTTIPFDQILGVSPFNIRQPDQHGDLTGLKATIRAAGLLQHISVHPAPGGKYQVFIGGRRWSALRELRDDEAPQPDWDWITVKLYEDHSETELRTLSAMENTQQRAMHPVREFEAFALIAAGTPPHLDAIEEIAREFGLTRQHVRQRLALGNLSPKIRAAWLAGDIDAEAAKAYAECDDIAAQEAYFDAFIAQDSVQWQRRDPHKIRKALLADWISGKDKLAHFVGAEAYVAAGGDLRDSLFAEEQRYTKTLVERLAREKLLALAEEVKREELWGFVVAEIDEAGGDHEPMEDFEPDYLPEEETRLGELRVRLQTHDNSPERREVEREAATIEAKAICRALPMAERLTLGVKASIDWRGEALIERAIMAIAPDETAEPDADQDAAEAAEPKASAPAAKKPEPLPASAPIGKQLRTVLDETIAHALHGAVSRNVNLALAIVVARLGCAYGGHSVDLRLHGRRNWTPARELLLGIESLSFDEALETTASAAPADVIAAFCELVGAAIDPARNDRIDEGLALLRACAPQSGIEEDLKLQFDAGCYFLAATREAALDAIKDCAGAGGAIDAAKLKTPHLRERATLLAKDNKWLPQVLRDALAAPAPAPPTPEPKPTADTRTTAQAMLDALQDDQDEFVAEEETSSASRAGQPIDALAEQFIAAHVEHIPGETVDVYEMDNAFYAYNKAVGGRLYLPHQIKAALIAQGLALVNQGAVGSVYWNIRLLIGSRVNGLTALGAGPEPATDIDRVNRFIIECCETGLSAGDVKASALGLAYNDFAAGKGWPTLTVQTFARVLADIGVEKHRLGKGVHYRGIALRADPTAQAAQ